MRYFDVFNGDADGICALHQLRLADPVASTLVTGLKRDIALLDRVPARSGDVVTVLDVSLDRNREALVAMLVGGVVVHYFDHHYAGGIPRHHAFLSVIDETGRLCTSAIVDRYLGGAHRAWAVVGAFGDGLDALGVDLARGLGIDAAHLEQLRALGVNLNYSAYGESADDVLVLPEHLYHVVSHYRDPLDLLLSESLIGRIDDVRCDDMARARAVAPCRAARRATAWVLPPEPWARRVIGTFANEVAARDPHRAHAVLVPRAGGGFVVSVRSPHGPGLSAAEFCRRYPGGGGRVAAAGIDRLDERRLDAFLGALDEAWPGPLDAAA